jgi:hypothetical protein
VVVDLATWTVTNRVSTPGGVAPFGVSLDGAQRSGAYTKPCDAGFYEGTCMPSNQCENGANGGLGSGGGGAAMRILDLSTLAEVGIVGGSEGVIFDPKTVVDPYVPASKIARKCTAKKRKAPPARR